MAPWRTPSTTQVVLDALALSLVTTAISLVLTVGLGLPMAIMLARRTFRGQSFLEALVDLPIVLPPSVAGIALLLAFGRNGLLGGALAVFGIAIPFTTVAVILAQTFVSMPFFIRSARTGIAGVDHDLEDAGRVDGASERQVFRSITVRAGVVGARRRAGDELGAGPWRVRRDDHVRRATSRAPPRPCRSSSTASSRGPASTPRSPRPTILILAAFGVLDRGPRLPLGPDPGHARRGLTAAIRCPRERRSARLGP